MTPQRKPLIPPPGFQSYSQQGASLVEIMVALVLSLILVAGVGQIYLGSKQSYRVQDGQSRLQENARAAIDILTRDIRSAGYFGCQSTIASPIGGTCRAGYAPAPANASPPLWCQFSPFVIANASPSQSLLTPGTTAVISGGDNADGTPPRFDSPSPALSAPLTTGIVKGTDAITILFGQSCNAVTTAGMASVDPGAANANNNICKWQTAPPSPGTPLIIADCDTAHIFRAATDTSQNTNFNGVATALLAMPNETIPIKTYAAGSEILLYRAYTYYIRFNPGNEPALYRYDNNANISNEMVEGIENMQIEYGIDIDNDGSVDQFKTQINANEWAAVKSVKITLTVRSVGEAKDNLANIANPPRFYNGNPNYVDKRLVKTFTATINLRNTVK